MVDKLLTNKWVSVEEYGLPTEQERIAIRTKSGIGAYGRNINGIFCYYDLGTDRMIQYSEFGGTGVAEFLYVDQVQALPVGRDAEFIFLPTASVVNAVDTSGVADAVATDGKGGFGFISNDADAPYLPIGGREVLERLIAQGVLIFKPYDWADEIRIESIPGGSEVLIGFDVEILDRLVNAAAQVAMSNHSEEVMRNITTELSKQELWDEVNTLTANPSSLDVAKFIVDVSPDELLSRGFKAKDIIRLARYVDSRPVFFDPSEDERVGLHPR
jgi:hypothetical protein